MNYQHICIYKWGQYQSTILTYNVSKPKICFFNKFFPYKLDSESTLHNKHKWGFTVHMYIPNVTLLHICTVTHIFWTAPETGKLPTRNPLVLTFTCKSGWQTTGHKGLEKPNNVCNSVHSEVKHQDFSVVNIPISNSRVLKLLHCS